MGPKSIHVLVVTLFTLAPAPAGADGRKPVDPTQIGILAALDGAAAQKVLQQDGLSSELEAAMSQLKKRKRVAKLGAIESRGNDAPQLIKLRAMTPRMRELVMKKSIYNRGRKAQGLASDGVPRLGRGATVKLEWVFSRAASAINACYGAPLREKQSRYDKIVTGVVVNRKGEVTFARVISTTFADDDMEGCIADALYELKFPRGLTRKQIEVAYPWTFVM